MIEYKSFRFEVKAVTDEGRVSGMLSPYNNVDHVNDVVRPGAFTKTLSEQKNVVPLLWQHDPDQPIGVNILSDTPESLNTEGVLNLDKQLGREALSDVKLWQQFGLKFGLSIGYETIKETLMPNGVRELLELKLWEGSLVTFPANPLAQVADAKRLERMYREIKEGRTISRATRERLTRMMDEISALLADGVDEQPDAEAAKNVDEPGTPLIEQLKSLTETYKWN